MNLQYLCFSWDIPQNDNYPKFKDFLVVMVTVMQIAYNLMGNLLFIQT